MNDYYFGQPTKVIELRVGEDVRILLTVETPYPCAYNRPDDGTARPDEIVLGPGYYVLHYPIGIGPCPMLGVVAEYGRIVWRAPQAEAA